MTCLNSGVEGSETGPSKLVWQRRNKDFHLNSFIMALTYKTRRHVCRAHCLEFGDTSTMWSCFVETRVCVYSSLLSEENIRTPGLVFLLKKNTSWFVFVVCFLSLWLLKIHCRASKKKIHGCRLNLIQIYTFKICVLFCCFFLWQQFSSVCMCACVVGLGCGGQRIIPKLKKLPQWDATLQTQHNTHTHTHLQSFHVYINIQDSC